MNLLNPFEGNLEKGVRKAAHKRSAKVTKTNFTRSSLAYGRLLLSGSSEQPLEC